MHDKKFDEVLGEIQALKESFNKLSMKVEVTLGSMGRKWETDLERMVLEIFKETLEREGIEPGKVVKFTFKDKDGSLTGEKGRIIEVVILVRDDKIYVIEVKSHAEEAHIDSLIQKARIVEKVFKKPVTKMVIVAVNIDEEAYQRAQKLGIKVIKGHVIK